MTKIGTSVVPFNQIQEVNRFFGARQINSGYCISLTEEDNEADQGWLVAWTNIMFTNCRRQEPIPVGLGLSMPEIVGLMDVKETGRTGENTNVLFCGDPFSMTWGNKKDYGIVLCAPNDATHIMTVNFMKNSLIMYPQCSVWRGLKTLNLGGDEITIFYDLLPLEEICGHNKGEILRIANSYFDCWCD